MKTTWWDTLDDVLVVMLLFFAIVWALKGEHARATYDVALAIILTLFRMQRDARKG